MVGLGMAGMIEMVGTGPVGPVEVCCIAEENEKRKPQETSTLRNDWRGAAGIKRGLRRCFPMPVPSLDGGRVKGWRRALIGAS